MPEIFQILQIMLSIFTETILRLMWFPVVPALDLSRDQLLPHSPKKASFCRGPIGGRGILEDPPDA